MVTRPYLSLNKSFERPVVVSWKWRNERYSIFATFGEPRSASDWVRDLLADPTDLGWLRLVEHSKDGPRTLVDWKP